MKVNKQDKFLTQSVNLGSSQNPELVQSLSQRTPESDQWCKFNQENTEESGSGSESEIDESLKESSAVVLSKPKADEFFSFLLSRPSLGSCFSSSITSDSINIDGGLLTLQLCLTAKQRRSEKGTGDEYSYGDKGREIEQKCGCFPF